MRQAHGVDDSPLGRIDRQQLPGLGPLLATLEGERGSSKDMNLGGRDLDMRAVRPARDRHMHDGGQLIAQIPISQRGVQADDAPWDPRADRRQIGAGADRATHPTKDAAADVDELPTVAQAIQLIARNTRGLGLPNPERPVAKPLQQSSRPINTHCCKSYTR